MGSGLCRRTGGRNPRATGVDGFYRKIVFNYAKKWTRYSDNHEHPMCGEKNAKHNKIRKNKPIISGPFPADHDQLEGDKWQYVILTRLDTEPPPERPPRTKRQRQRQRHDTLASGHSWGSLRRRSFGRKRPPRPRRRVATVTPAIAQQPSDRDNSDSAAELMRLAMMVYLRRPTGRPLPAWTSAPTVAAVADRIIETPSPPTGHCVKKSPWILHSSGRTRQSSHSSTLTATRDGFFQSIERVIAMTNNLLL